MPIDEAAVQRLLSWDGIGRAIERRIEHFEAAVRADAPFQPDKAGPHIVDSISHTKEEEGPLLVSRVGTHPSEHLRGYAYIVHEGSRPHEIRPRVPGKSLRFKVAGRIVYATRVNHPGTQPDRFLTRNMGVLL